MPDEKGEEGEEEELHNPVTVCVCRAHGLPDLPQPVEETERQRETGSEQRRGEGGAAAEKSEVVPPFPVTRETNALSKKIGQWQTPAIVFRQKVT